MRAARLHEIGGPQQVRVETVADPTPGPGELRVRLHCAAFNRRDVFITQGLYPGIELPAILGSDGCGTVDAHGPGTPGPAVGTRVVIDPTIGWGDDPRVWSAQARILGMPRPGTFADYVCVPAENVHAAPPELDDREAAAIPLAGVTAYRAVFTRGACRPDDVVLVTGVGGGVQTFALAFAKTTGARVVVTSSSDEKLARARALGADAGVNYRTAANWSREVRALTDGGPTLVIDSAGGETFARALDVARPGARVVTYGGTVGDATIRMFSLFWKQLDVRGTSMGSPQDFRRMLQLIAEARLRPAVDEVVPLDDVAAAAERVAQGGQFGKVVLQIA